MRPRLSLHDGFFLDTRKKGEREIVNPAWKPKDGKNPLRIEIADKNDLILLANFFNHHFIEHNNLRKALGATYEEMEEFCYDRAVLAVKKPLSYLVFDGNKLAAAVLRTYYNPDEYYELFNGELFHKNPKFLIKEDYAEDIMAKGYSLNASRIAVLGDTIISQIGKFLLPDVKNLGFTIAVGVHLNYMRNGLHQHLVYEAIKKSKSFNCNYGIAIAVADASFESSKKTFIEPLFCLHYKDFKENGKPVFSDDIIPDKCCYAVIAKKKEMLQLIEALKKQSSNHKSNI